MQRQQFVHLVDAERDFQEVKHGAESCASPTNTDSKRLAILVEEVGEVAKALTYDCADEANLMDELVQVAAMSIEWIVAIDEERERELAEVDERA